MGSKAYAPGNTVVDLDQFLSDLIVCSVSALKPGPVQRATPNKRFHHNDLSPQQ
jgi:hypothetical protein